MRDPRKQVYLPHCICISWPHVTLVAMRNAVWSLPWQTTFHPLLTYLSMWFEIIYKFILILLTYYVFSLFGTDFRKECNQSYHALETPTWSWSLFLLHDPFMSLTQNNVCEHKVWWDHFLEAVRHWEQCSLTKTVDSNMWAQTDNIWLWLCVLFWVNRARKTISSLVRLL